MSALSPSVAAGLALLYGSSSFRGKDDAADYKIAGVFTQKDIQFSATEANEWIGFFLAVSTVLKSQSSTVQEVRGEVRRLQIQTSIENVRAQQVFAARIFG